MMEWKNNQKRNEKIRQLLKSGESVNYIAKTLECNKSTVSYYANKIGINHNDKVKRRIKNAQMLAAAAGSEKYLNNWTDKRKSVIQEAINEWPEIKSDPHMMLFLGLYWGEGNKRNGQVGIVNNDPGIIKICHKIMIEQINRLDIVIRCYPEHDWDECQKFWESLLNKPVKIRKKKWLGKKRKMWSEYGICHVRGSNWEFYIKLITWISLLREEATGIKHTIDPSQSSARGGLYSTIDFGAVE